MMTSEGKVAMDVCQNSGPTPSHCPRTTEDIAADDSGCADSREEDTVRIEPEGIFGRYSPSFLKERGNAAYKDRDYIGAREFYSEAIARLEHTNNDILRAQLYANRAACHMAVEDFDAAVEDTTDAIMLDSSYVKVSAASCSGGPTPRLSGGLFGGRGVNVSRVWAWSSVSERVRADLTVDSRKRSGMNGVAR
ncbi:tetratricopeptide repeat protein 1 [Babesia caballi]|uniref:Tetratricopeptide repeat protein 1 n=1 Tax=Babesia caballi TaxID=5871 RepID=A0AAV4LXY9_BABCB|nr:tetratricopeptide repeat protein 1 [Babesia caballi]